MALIDNPLTVENNFLRIIVVLVSAAGVHMLVLILRRLSRRLASTPFDQRHRKWKSVTSLVTSSVVFVLYFFALGLILREFGISLTAYLASASVIGLAIGFGSQGIVQDVVTGLTLIFSDLYDVGDMVEIGGQTGIVRSIGMRFTVIENHLKARISIPNRSISSVINYPEGHVRCLVDVTLPAEASDVRQKLKAAAAAQMSSVTDQFPGVMMKGATLLGIAKTASGKEYLRLQFRIWPGRGGLLEGTFKQELIQSLRTIEPAFADWMIAVHYEIERK